MVSNPIYLSTGWTFAHTDSFDGLQEYHTKYATFVDGFELSATSSDRVKDYIELDLPESLEYTIHGSPTQDPWQLELLLARTEPKSVVYHPTRELSINTLVEFYSEYDVVPTIENLDGRVDREEADMLLSLKSTIEFGFTLDTQHVYEHDPSMAYGWELLNKYGDGLTQIHVSGERVAVDSNHELVHSSDNMEEIAEFIRRVGAVYSDVPLIIEGKYGSVREVEREVQFLREL